MNRPSDYRKDILDEGKMSNAKFLEKYGTKTYQGAVTNITKTTFTIWMKENIKITFEKRWRKSHQRIWIGDVVQFYMAENIGSHKASVLCFAGMDNSLIDHKYRNSMKKKKAPITRLTSYDTGMHSIKIVQEDTNYLWIEMNGKIDKIRRPRNLKWEDKQLNEVFDIKIVEYEITNQITNEKKMQKRLENIL